MAWGVCEQLLSTAWKALLADTKAASRMTRERSRKLEGRDYTASVMTEILELGMRIDYEFGFIREEVPLTPYSAHPHQFPNEA